MEQLVQGVLYLHSHGIIHRDLTLGNLLLTKNMEVVSHGTIYMYMYMFIFKNNYYIYNVGYCDTNDKYL